MDIVTMHSFVFLLMYFALVLYILCNDDDFDDDDNCDLNVCKYLHAEMCNMTAYLSIAWKKNVSFTRY